MVVGYGRVVVPCPAAIAASLTTREWLVTSQVHGRQAGGVQGHFRARIESNIACEGWSYARRKQRRNEISSSRFHSIVLVGAVD